MFILQGQYNLDTKISILTSVTEDVEKWKLLYTATGSIQQYLHFAKA